MNVKGRQSIGAMFEFLKDGRALRLRNVFLVTENSADEGILRAALSKLINPIHLEKLRRIIRRTNLD